MEEDINLLAERDTEEGNRIKFKSIKCILRSFQQEYLTKTKDVTNANDRGKGVLLDEVIYRMVWSIQSDESGKSQQQFFAPSDFITSLVKRKSKALDINNSAGERQQLVH